MLETYDIMYDGTPVGTARIERQGLYYLFSCRCRLPDEGLYRIHAVYGDAREDLGICVPMGNAFGMDKKISAKRLSAGTPSFELVPKDWQPRKPVMDPEPELITEEENIRREFEEETATPAAETERFLPVAEDEPFDHLDKLENARMEVRDDVAGIVIQE